MPTEIAPDQVIQIHTNITKVTAMDDGSCMVYGRLGGETVDLDNQILDKAWMDATLPKWFNERGNIRAMHGKVAAGKAKQLIDTGDGYDLVAKIVDKAEVQKCLEGVYTGFSIGVKGAMVKADKMASNGRICGGVPIEASLVDNPCDQVNTLKVIDKGASLETVAVAPTDAEILADTASPIKFKAAATQKIATPATEDDEAALQEKAAALIAKRNKLDKGADDETQSINLGEQVKLLLKSLISHESSELDDEPGDIALLNSCFSSMCSFVENEQREQADFLSRNPAVAKSASLCADLLDGQESDNSTLQKMAHGELRGTVSRMLRAISGKPADISKVATTNSLFPDTDLAKIVTVGDLQKVLTPEALKAALGGAFDEKIESLKTEVAEMGKRAISGGPAVRPSVDIETTKQSAAKVAILGKIADMEPQVHSADPNVREGAIRNIEELRTQLLGL